MLKALSSAPWAQAGGACQAMEDSRECLYPAETLTEANPTPPTLNPKP